MIKRIVYITLCINVLIGCNNDSTDNSLNTKDTVNQNQVSVYIINELDSLTSNLLPSCINNFLYENPDIEQFNVISNYSCNVFVKNEFYAYFNVFWDFSGEKYLCISLNKIDSLSENLTSSLYFLKKKDDEWINVSHLLLPTYAIDIVKLETGNEVKYMKIHLKEKILAFNSEKSKTGFSVNFEKSDFYINKIVITETDSVTETAFLKLNWNENIFEIDEIIDNSNYEVLSDIELENVKQYYSLSEALIDSDLVYILDISGQNYKSLPKEIKYLKKLQILNLDDNQLKTLPSEIGVLTNLQVIRIDNNKLNELPSEIGKLTNLIEISLANNNLSKLPKEFGNLTNLRKINIDENDFVNLPVQLFNLEFLASISVSDNSINIVSTNITKLNNLFYLNLSNNQLTSLPDNLYELENLKELYISGNNINSKILEKLKKSMPNTFINN